MTIARFIPIVILLFLSVLIMRAQISPKDRWLQLKTPTFSLIGNAGEKDLRAVGTKLEQFRSTFKKLFPKAKFESTTPTSIIVFKSDASYSLYKPKRFDGTSDPMVAGFFLPGEATNYITLAADGDMNFVYDIIFHEFVHSMLDAGFGTTEVPPWLGEGLATYYQTFEIKNDQVVRLGRLPRDQSVLAGTAQLMPLRSLLTSTRASFHPHGRRSQQMFYAQAWVFVHYMMLGNSGANLNGFGKFVGQVMNNVDPEKAFVAAFGTTFEGMDADLRKYARQKKFNTEVLTFEQKLLFDSTFSISPVPEAVVNANLGDLLFHIQDYAAADAHLSRAISLDPSLAAPHISKGLLKARLKDFASARTHVERAVTNEPINYYAQYALADVIGRAALAEPGTVKFPPEAYALIRSALDRSISLNPKFAPSYRLLAIAGLKNETDLDASSDLINRAIALQPERQELRLILAQIYAKQSRLDDAMKAIEPVRRSPEDNSVRDEAQRIAD